jgi:hypothetical protein
MKLSNYTDYYVHLCHEITSGSYYWAARCDKEHIGRVFDSIIQAKQFAYQIYPNSHIHVFGYRNEKEKGFSTVLVADIVELAYMIKEDLNFTMSPLMEVILKEDVVPDFFASIPECGHRPEGWID